MGSFFRLSYVLVLFYTLTLVASCAPSHSELNGTNLLEGDLALLNGNFIDPKTETERHGGVVIRDGIIVAELDEVPKDFAGEVIDLDGKWVIPGLIDMHTHSFGNQIPGPAQDFVGTEDISQRLLAAGVTGFLDLFGDEEQLFDVRARQQNGEIGGADIYASLSCLTAPDGHCSEYGIPTRTMTSPDEAAAVVADLAKRAPDVIKIVYQPSDDQPSIDKATFASAVTAANRAGLKTIVHIKTWDDIRDAIEVGATAITHTPRGPIPMDIPKLMADSGIITIPTLTVHTDLVDFLFDEQVLNTSLARKMAPEGLIDAYRDPGLIERYRDSREEFEARNLQTMAAVRAMIEARVTVLAGTDAGNWGTVQGYSVHREMINLVEAGLTPWQALAAATTLAGEFLNIPVGVSVGDQANLVVLNASPVEDIHNTQEIVFVIHHGSRITP